MVLKVTFDEMIASLDIIGKNILHSKNPAIRKIRYVCPVMRGGSVPAAYLARITGRVLVLGCTASTRHTPGGGAANHFKFSINPYVRKIIDETLFVDDFVDSGFTLEQLKLSGVKHFTAPFQRKGKGDALITFDIFKPPVNILSDEWLVFPWEILDSKT